MESTVSKVPQKNFQFLPTTAPQVGIATATYSRSGSGRGSGVNFALPIDKVVKVVPQLIVYGNAAGKRI
ncbi:hypothetical protein DUNSADRAFT_14933 [Dunaliella salina]|uniref:Encoded protein n=1 Tax=Dunaliella salina TaxID=3046 RepID=A0ABQ7G6E5_DUNSA|nr:hypothetical protein DUNSADRAFT_14933 [Dunaliella salina]|eukprot:KAF5830178.1 hypothetical protein DUNSADRAFT_14933 [Dunaliella salina]